MAITSEEARKRTPDRVAYLKSLEEEIDYALEHSFGEGRSKMLMARPAGFDDDALRELRKIYGKAGWNIKYVYSQRDGDYLKFTAKRKKK